jgi:hypothetical protein
VCVTVCWGRGGPRALTSSAIFQTFDPFRKARCSPAAAAAAQVPLGRPGRQRASRPGSRALAPPAARRGAVVVVLVVVVAAGPLTAPPGPRRAAPHPLSPLPAPGPRPARPPSPLPSTAATHALCEPLTLSPGSCSQRRPVLPPGCCSRRHGGPAAAAAAPAGLHA